MSAASLLVFCLGLTLAYGNPTRSPCSDLSGTWSNQLGSNMTIKRVDDSSMITGRYHTAVESSRGASTISSNITGIVHTVEGGSLIAFNVLWNNGKSITAWVGQCIVCQGVEKIYTTWALRSLKERRKNWMSTLINEDTFSRVNSTSGSTPGEGTAVTDSSILGNWHSETGDSLSITNAFQEKIMKGLHKAPTAVDGAPVFGQFDGNQTYTALGFASVHGNHITGWAGHIYNPHDNKPLMQTSWLSYSFSNLCKDPRKNVNYGMHYYKKSVAEE
ncbi:uncharacterized protein TNCT_685311 [Trichonephila clavata]|uniref:Uncharacterized protein n=1 Tax=Trichonephila clavata TaxID=2740835 RepID=A0A8X6GXY0_TRICU|nr:uncharacterized protein TNCT_685311 [Trichonephila clavata]